MFTQKLKSLTSENAFVKEALKESVKTESENGAKKYSSSLNVFVDQFNVVGSYKKPRSYKEVDNDMVKLWAENPFLALRFVFYIRTVTRTVKLFDGKTTDSVTRGAGLKHEAILRMIWVAVN